MTTRLRTFLRFWYDFIVGDDWTVAVAVVIFVALTAAVSHESSVAWPVLPIGVAAILGASVWRALKAHARPNGEGHG